MDDTVLLATSRERAIRKLNNLIDFCKDSGMVINQSEKFVVAQGDANDRVPIVLPGIIIENCEEYPYLGVILTQDGSAVTAVKRHFVCRMANVMKFVAFVKKNVDFPFWVKNVFEADLLSTTCILYGCEAWLGNSDSVVEVAYRSLVKVLFGVSE